MITPINILIAVLWGLSAFVDYNEYIYLWQLKEYRIDRVRDFFSTKLGQAYWRRYSLVWRSLLALLALLWPINSILLLKYGLIIIFAVDFVRNTRYFLMKRLRHPVYTVKSVVLIFGSLAFEVIIFLLTKDWSLVFLLLVLRFLLAGLLVQIFKLPTGVIKRFYIAKATKKLSSFKNIKVIGVTGSYGKTTVKTFLSHILSKNFKVIHTPKNVNTEIGIAKFILSSKFQGMDVLIVEMGAYKIGEIDLICRMVKPDIGILTAINEQHLSLFGGIKKTQQAKYELLRSLSQDGLAVVNSDNKYCREYLSDLECKVFTFGTEEEFKPSVLIKDIEKTSSGISCRGYIHGEECRMSASVLGEHNAMNIAPCVLVALELGMKKDEIQNQLGTLSLPEHTLEKITYGKATILDDSYNANKDGFFAALDVLNSFPSSKYRIVITRGVPELGSESDSIHEEIGGAVAYAADLLVVITDDFYEPLQKGVGNKYNTEVKRITDSKELLEFVKDNKEKDAVILLENRIPDTVYKELVDEKL